MKEHIDGVIDGSNLEMTVSGFPGMEKAKVVIYH